MPVLFEIHNTRTNIYWADLALLAAIDRATSYRDASAGTFERPPPDDSQFFWDGWIRFLHKPKRIPPWIPTGLLPRALAACVALGREHRVEDRRERPEIDVPRYLQPLPLWEHQRRCVDACTNPPVVGPEPLLFGQGVIDLPPRSGKTRTLLEVFRRVDQPTIWIAPTNAIVEQTAACARQFFSQSDVVIASSSTLKDAVHARLVVATAAAALSLPTEFYQTRRALILDEFHHYVKTGAWGRDIAKKTEHIFWRFGATGTHFRSQGDDLALEATLSRVVFRMSSEELLALGRLVPTDVVFVPVSGPKVRGVGSDFISGFGRAGIHEHDTRNRFVAAAAVHLYRTGRNVLVLVGTKRQGYSIRDFVRSNIPPAKNTEFETVEFISTDRSRAVQQKLISSFTSHGEVRILIGTSIVGEGVDLPSADALVWARGEKAAVSLVQGWFRVCTAAPGKRNAIIVDFADRHHPRLLEHSVERLNIAAREPIFRISVLGSPENFAGWVSKFSDSGVSANQSVA